MTNINYPRRRAITRNFRCGVPRNLSLADNASDVLFLRSDSGTDPVNHLWFMSLSPVDSAEHKIVDVRELMGGTGEELPAAEQARRERLRESSSGITSFSSDRDHLKVCFAVSGALWVHDVGSGRNHQRVGSGVTTPTMDPTGQWIAFTRGGSLFVISTNDDPSEREFVVCESTSDSETWGSAEFIAAEEMGRYSGSWWSPHGHRLLVTHVDESPVDQWWISDPGNPDRRPRAVRYPAAGSANARVRLFLVGIAGERVEATWDHEQYEYLANVSWSKHGDPLVSVQSRDQQSVVVLSIDPETGKTTVLAVRGREPRSSPTSSAGSSAAKDAGREPTSQGQVALESRNTGAGSAAAPHSDSEPDRMPWVDLIPGVPRLTSHGLADIVVDAQCDTRRLVLSTGAQEFLTPAGLQVNAVQDADTSGITFLASEDPTTQDLFRVDYSGKVQRLSRSGAWSTGRSVPNAFATFRADPETPTTSVSITVGRAVTTTGAVPEPPGSDVPVAVDDRRIMLINHSEDPGVEPRPEIIASGSMGPDTAVLWPADLPEGINGPLPIIMSPYGGPHAQRVIRAASAFTTEQWIADHGYCVIVADGAGTPRTPSFEQSICGNLASGALQGQVDALTAVVARYGDRVDPGRVGIRGWSFGGYLAALAVLERPDLFHAAVAGAPVTDWALYDTHYTERYLGTPQANPELYLASGLIDKAHKLTRPLLLVHGLNDDNVFAAHTLRLSTALLAAGRAHTVLPLTGVSHMTPQEDVAENLLRLDFEFLRAALTGPSQEGR